MAKDALYYLAQTVANIATYAATLEAQRDAALEQVAQLTAERDALKAELAKVQTELETVKGEVCLSCGGPHSIGSVGGINRATFK